MKFWHVLDILGQKAMTIKGFWDNKKEILEVGQEMKAVGANFDHLKEALDEVVNEFKQIQ
jgi:hypothetical protein